MALPQIPGLTNRRIFESNHSRSLELLRSKQCVKEVNHQSQGNYTIFEAGNGAEALEIARREAPDLIILDLMMPEIDGFAVLDQLKANPVTASIPVIVVTAKELSQQENERMRGQIHALLQKGEFMNDDFIDEITSLIG